MEARIVRVDGYRLRTLTWGAAGGDVVVLPGIGATYRTLAPQVRFLRRRGHRVHVVELPGTTLPPSLRREDASFPALADLVAAGVDALGVRGAVFLGHSLGGGIALHLAVRRRDLVSGLALLAPAALGSSLVWLYRLYSLPIVGRALLRPTRRGGADYARRFLIGSLRRDDAPFVSSLLRVEHGDATRALTTRSIVWANQPRRIGKLRALLLPGGEQCAFTLCERVSELRGIPTLLLWGAQDRIISAGDALRCRARNREVLVRIAPGVGHMLPLEAPEWADAHIARFLDSLAPSAARAA